MRTTARYALIVIILAFFCVHAHAQAPVITPTTHLTLLTWQWSQGAGAPAAQFNVMRSTSSGGCTQIAAVTPATVNTFPAGCLQVGVVPASILSFTDQGNATSNLLIEGRTYCYVIVAQGSNGNISQDGTPEVCGSVPFVGGPSAPTGQAGVFK